MLPPKIKMFLWRVKKDILLFGDSLKRRRVDQINPLCIFCKEEGEFVYYMSVGAIIFLTV